MIKTDIDWTQEGMFSLAHAASMGDEAAQSELLSRLGLDPKSEEAKRYLGDLTLGNTKEESTPEADDIEQY